VEEPAGLSVHEAGESEFRGVFKGRVGLINPME
jgi:hypothetical protein